VTEFGIVNLGILVKQKEKSVCHHFDMIQQACAAQGKATREIKTNENVQVE
jgi:hypothetical protein